MIESLSEPHVLVVDDEPAMTRLLKKAITHKLTTDVSVTIAHTVGEAEQIVRSVPPCVLLTDLDLGEVNGFHLLRWIRQFDPRIPVIVFTGYRAPDAEINAYTMGAVDFYTKPVNTEQLANTVAHYVGRYQARYLVAAN